MKLYVACTLILYNFINVHCVGEEFYLQQGEKLKHTPDYRKENLKIYCYTGKPKYIIYLWQSVWLEIDLKSDNYDYYEGGTADIVRKQYLEHRSSWGIDLFSWKQKNFKLNPFNQSCIGIDSTEPYAVHLHSLRVDYWKVLLLVIGIVGFLSAKKLSQNVLFYYLCGISLGICASFIILIYFFSKMFPKKPMMYGVAICGWTVGIYILQMLWDNMQTILMRYHTYVAWYILTAAVTSFIVCYRWGPVTNERTKNLIQWSLQIASAVAVFHSTHFQEAGMGQIVILLIIYNFPQKWISKSKTYWKRKFPPKVRLLKNAEYYQQGVHETQKALSELRTYCSSPECNQWNTALKLSDVKRFNYPWHRKGGSHLSDDEILEYETSIHTTDLTDEEGLTDDDS